MKTKLCTITLLAFATLSEATEQERELLVVRGKRIFTHDTPELKEAFPNLEIPKFGMISTANHKGYTATWGVIEGQLYLFGLEATNEVNGDILWDEMILKDQKFPVKVVEWSGEVTQTIPRTIFDPNTRKTDKYNNVTTIVFVNGVVTKVDFDKKVPRKRVPLP
jgi:hypothetical protein